MHDARFSFRGVLQLRGAYLRARIDVVLRLMFALARGFRFFVATTHQTVKHASASGVRVRVGDQIFF